MESLNNKIYLKLLRNMRSLQSLILAIMLLALPASHQAQNVERDIIAAIKDEGLHRSQVMDTVEWLSDTYGPRITGSPAIEDAKIWTMQRLQQWGVLNVHEERFAFGKGWALERFHAHMIKPQVMPIIGYPKSWSSSTNGIVSADVVRVDIRAPEDLEKYRGTLQGKIVLSQRAREVRMLDSNLALRMDDALLTEAKGSPSQTYQTQQIPNNNQISADLLEQFYVNEGVVALFDRGSDAVIVSGAPMGSNLTMPVQRADGGTVFVGIGGPRDKNSGKFVPSATLAVEHYNRMVRLLERGVPVKVEINIQTRFYDEEERLNGFNIIGEIPGADLSDEVVMLGAHFDSMHASTGATDNASGTAAMMEALRILLAVDAKPRRTIRIALWGGEEQGLLGSRAYAHQHFGNATTMELKPAHEKVSAYYNLDNGAGRIRGIWLQSNTAVEPIFSQWIDELQNLGVTTIGQRTTRGTDHLSFDLIGLPSFQFIQDPLEYNSRTHHSNMDFFDRIQKHDMLQMSVVAAIFAYKTAMLDERLPRKT
jgi:carboxypeptidase Q